MNLQKFELVPGSPCIHTLADPKCERRKFFKQNGVIDQDKWFECCLVAKLVGGIAVISRYFIATTNCQKSDLVKTGSSEICDSLQN